MGICISFAMTYANVCRRLWNVGVLPSAPYTPVHFASASHSRDSVVGCMLPSGLPCAFRARHSGAACMDGLPITQQRSMSQPACSARLAHSRRHLFSALVSSGGMGTSRTSSDLGILTYCPPSPVPIARRTDMKPPARSTSCHTRPQHSPLLSPQYSAMRAAIVTGPSAIVSNPRTRRVLLSLSR